MGKNEMGNGMLVMTATILAAPVLVVCHVGLDPDPIKKTTS
jgi:ketopantoate hydroxymethyltransferase